MADYILLIFLLALFAALIGVFLRRSMGPPRSRLGTSTRIVITTLLSLVIVAFLLYGLSRSRTFQLAGNLVSRVRTDEKVIALTFDDGPTRGHTEQVLNILDDYDIPATFYLTGWESAENPAQLRQIVGRGHEVGNHTYDHTRMWFQSKESMAEGIGRTDELFRSAGYGGPVTFRPPGCKKLLAGPLYLGSTRRTTVTWDLEPDSLEDIANDSDAMTEYVVENARPGSIVLMHVMYDSRSASRKALPDIIERLTAEGYRFVTVSQLLNM